MCGRYSLAPTKKQKELLEKKVKKTVEIPPRYNIAPTQKAWVITAEQPNQLTEMEWGLIPNWSNNGLNTGKLINARSETLLEKPSFKLLFHERRCLIPADSFYEWKKNPGGRKIPYRILLENGDLLFFAGIWDEWNGKQTFSIITTTPNAEMTQLHN